MRMDDYFDTIENSSPDEWLSVERQPYLSNIQKVSFGGRPFPTLEAEKPNSYFVYRQNISIAIEV